MYETLTSLPSDDSAMRFGEVFDHDEVARRERRDVGLPHPTFPRWCT